MYTVLQRSLKSNVRIGIFGFVCTSSVGGNHWVSTVPLLRPALVRLVLVVMLVIIPPYGSMVGVFSLLCLFLYGYGFLSDGKRQGRETLHACSTTIWTGFLPFWWTLARVESRRRHYFQDVRIDALAPCGGSRRGSVGSRNWGWQRRVRPYGRICVLQACWRTSCFFFSGMHY